MVITLHTQEILDKLRSISHREVSVIEDADARYRAEAGTEKMYEIERCVTEAASRLAGRAVVARFLKADFKWEKDNRHELPSEYVFDFVLSERRAVGTATPLEDAMNTFMVEYALTKFYSIVSLADLSNKHSLLAIDAGNEIDSILYTKKPPRV